MNPNLDVESNTYRNYRQARDHAIYRVCVRRRPRTYAALCMTILVWASTAAAQSGVVPPEAITTAAVAATLATDVAGTPGIGAILAPEKSSAPVADETSASLDTIARVYVSTRRHVESSQSVPTSMSVLSDKALESDRIYRVQDLQQLLPSTTVNFVHARQLSFAIRGLGNNTANDGLEGSVGLYLDNVYLARPGMAAFDALDLQQIDLLRGPQGTVFGKNTTAGVLNITSAGPTYTPQYSVEVSAGQDGYRQSKVTASGPLSDTVAGRVTLYQTHEGGYITNIYNNSRLQGGDRQGVRVQLLFESDSHFNARMIADYHTEDSTIGTMLLYSAGPTGKFLTQAALVGSAPILDPGLREVNLDSSSHVSVHQGGLSAEANWNLANDYKVTAITAYRFWDFVPHNSDGLSVPDQLNIGIATRHQQFTQEVRLATPSSGAVDSVLGAYYYFQNLNDVTFSNNGSVYDAFNGTPAGALSNVNSYADGHLRVNSFALFEQSIWHIAPRWDFTGGVRTTYEDKLATEVRFAPNGGAVVTGTALAVRNARDGAYNSGDVRLNNFSPSALATLAYKVCPDVLAFGTLSHGEKSGGINLSVPGAAGSSSLIVGNERANNLELGAKSNLFENHLQLNSSLYWTIVHGYQNNAYDPTSNTFYLTNAGNVQSRGLEVEVTARVTHELMLGASGSFNDVKYLDYKDAPCPPEINAISCDLSGRHALVNAPRLIGNVSAQYTQVLTDNVEAYYNANYAYRTSVYGTLDASLYSRIPSYGVGNLSAGIKVKYGLTHWDISLWAKNVSDKQYYTSTWNTSFGAYNAVIGTPRTLGLTARADF